MAVSLALVRMQLFEGQLLRQLDGSTADPLGDIGAAKLPSPLGRREVEPGEFSTGGGAHLLFERDDWGPEVMLGYCPWPADDAQYNDLFNRMGRILRESFTFANRLNIKTCIGTEAPLTIPARLRNRLKTKGRDPIAPATFRELY